jgi:hypothetical protein
MSMDRNKKTFLFIRKYMGIGGIENYLYRTVKELKKNGHRVVWIFPVGGYIDDGFKEVFNDEELEIVKVDFSKVFWINRVNVTFSKDEKVCALAFNIFEFNFLEMIKRKYKYTSIDSFFWVPHFEEKAVFIEKFAPKILQPIFKKYVGRIIFDMEKNSNIIYVNKSHLEALTKNYNYKVEDEESKFLTVPTREIPSYDYDLAVKRSKREYFNIITIGRFSFPHKAYVLGLIKTYGELKMKYDSLRLTIIGYGPDEDKVKYEINKLNSKTKRDINLIGKVPYDELRRYLEEAHLNIGVAGTIGDGALTGLISIPVRHYCEECQGYGYLPFSKKYTTSSAPGKPIKDYIEEVIDMTTDKYLELSKTSYDTYDTRKLGNGAEHLLKKKNKNPHKVLRKRYILFVWMSYRCAKIIRNLKRSMLSIKNKKKVD